MKPAGYYSWLNMLTRCYNPNSRDYPRYGGRGIAVCERWRRSFAAFAADMGPRPDGYTLERKDNTKGYEPGNCVWATRQAQSRNRRTTIWIEAQGVRLCVNDWARRLGVSINSLRSRAATRGSYEAAIASYATQPLNPKHNRH